MAIFLCGFMGCGKTTVGKRMAVMLGRKYCDMDELIVEKAGMSIPEIFEKLGEPEFRRMESELIVELGSFSGIVSCGGGAMLSEKNGKNAEKSGVVVFLDVPFETCYSRIKNDSNRPLVVNNTKEQLKALYDDRYPKYKANSGISVCCCEGPDKTASDVIRGLKDCGVLK
jgi:shikimate kinase